MKSKQGHLTQKIYRASGKVKKSNWYLIHYQDGKRKEVSTKTKNRQEAELFRSHYMARFRRRGGDATPEVATIGDLLDLVAADYRENRRKSTEDIDWKIRVLRDLIGAAKVATFGTNAIKALQRDLRKRGGVAEKELSNGSLNRYMALLRRAFQLGLQHEPPMVDRMPTFRMLPESSPRQGVLSHPKYLELREHLPSYARLALVLGYHTGMRSGELLEIQAADVDLAAGVISLRRETTKNSEPKKVPIYGDMAGEIAEALRSNDPRCPYLVQRWVEGGRVFCQTGGLWAIKLKSPATVKMLERADLPKTWVLRDTLRIKAKTEAAARDVLERLGVDRVGEPIGRFRKVWASACRAVGVPGLKFHDLRRTAAVRMIEAGLDERLAMEIGGWKTRAMLDRYAIRTPERMRKAGEKLAAHMATLAAPVKQAGRVS